MAFLDTPDGAGDAGFCSDPRQFGESSSDTSCSRAPEKGMRTLRTPGTLSVQVKNDAPPGLQQFPRQRHTRQVAIINEWFERTGGAERVLLAVRDAFPSAETYVLWSDRDVADYPQLHESWLASTPLRGHKALTLPLMPLVWRTQTRQRYDVVLTLSHSLNHTARFPVNPGGVHLSYVHTPARYLWLPEIDPRRTGVGQRFAVEALKRFELRTNRHVASYAANSETVRLRIQKFWHREARVIHPPCRTAYFADAPAEQRNQDRDYLLGFGRWVEYKRFDFMIKVAEQTNLPLVIAGSGTMEDQLRHQAAGACADVRFETRPDDERLRELHLGCPCAALPLPRGLRHRPRRGPVLRHPRRRAASRRAARHRDRRQHRLPPGHP